MQIDAAELGYALTQSPWRHLAEAGSRTHQALSDRRSIVEANRVFPVLDDLAVPIRSLFVLLLVFAVVAPPGLRAVVPSLRVMMRRRPVCWLRWIRHAGGRGNGRGVGIVTPREA